MSAPGGAGDAEESIRSRIDGLVSEERELRRQIGVGEISRAEEQARLRAVEIELDQCWDLLRQRDARRSAGQDPDEARPRDPSVVESYEG